MDRLDPQGVVLVVDSVSLVTPVTKVLQDNLVPMDCLDSLDHEDLPELKEDPVCPDNLDRKDVMEHQDPKETSDSQVCPVLTDPPELQVVQAARESPVARVTPAAASPDSLAGPDSRVGTDSTVPREIVDCRDVRAHLETEERDQPVCREPREHRVYLVWMVEMDSLDSLELKVNLEVLAKRVYQELRERKEMRVLTDSPAVLVREAYPDRTDQQDSTERTDVPDCQDYPDLLERTVLWVWMVCLVRKEKPP